MHALLNKVPKGVAAEVLGHAITGNQEPHAGTRKARKSSFMLVLRFAKSFTTTMARAAKEGLCFCSSGAQEAGGRTAAISHSRGAA